MAKKTRNYFVCYHHAYDTDFLEDLREMKSGMKVADYSLKEDISHLTEQTIYKKIRDKMRNCSVTIILVGSRTGHRKWIDWELWASLRGYAHPTDPYKSFKPNGLLAIFLPGSHSIPERLQDNIDSGYAVCMKWENFEEDFESKVNFAHWKRTNNTHKIDNSREKINRNYFNFLGIKL
jgi:hypothetical protein